MNPEHDQDDDEQIEEEMRARSLVSTRWVRGVIVFAVMAVIAAIALPYALDWSDPPLSKATAVTGNPSPAPAPKATPPPSPPPPSGGSGGSTPAQAASAPSPQPERVEVAQAVKPAPPLPPPPAAPKETPGAAREADAPKAPPKSPVTKKEPAPRPASPAADTKGASDTYWVQVGAFKDAETANRLAARLREQNFRVQQSMSRVGGGAPAAPAAPPPAAAEAPKVGVDRYEVIVSGPSPAEVSTKLSAKGLAFQPGPDGAVITPSLPLGEAVALSKDLSGENLAVKVRRVAARAATATTAVAEGGESIHRVRVGSFPDRASAQAALRDLEAKGYKPFLARGE